MPVAHTVPAHLINEINRSNSISGRLQILHREPIPRVSLGGLLDQSQKRGKRHLDLTARAIVLKSADGDIREASELIHWSKQKPASVRKQVVKSFLSNRQGAFFVHQVAEMKRADARDSMKDFFAAGGSDKDLATWLMMAGEVLRTGTVPGDTDGLWGWIKDTASDIADAVTGAINTVADAVAAAGRSLANAISQVAGWAQNKISDFVEAILQAGQSVAQVLGEAVKKGTRALSKFVRAILDAGREAVEILNWVVSQSRSIIREVVRTLWNRLRSMTSLIQHLARMAHRHFRAILQALLDIGRSVASLVQALAHVASAVVRQVITDLLALGKSIRDLIRAAASRSWALAKKVVAAMLDLGRALADILKEIAGAALNQIRNLLRALKSLGRSAYQVLVAMVDLSTNLLERMVEQVVRLWSRLTDVLIAAVRISARLVQIVLKAVLGTGRHLLTVLRAILNDIRASFRQGLIEGLLAIGRSALTLLKEALKISLSAVTLLFTIILEIFGGSRGLTWDERREARRIFGASIDLDLVRITVANLPVDVISWLNNDRPFATMYLINVASWNTLTTSVLIHELTHVWQAEKSGPVYMLEALCSQFFGRGYVVTEADLRQANGDLLKLEREQQAEVVQRYWEVRFGNQRPQLPMSLIEPLARQVFEPVRRISPLRIGRGHSFRLNSSAFNARNLAVARQ